MGTRKVVAGPLVKAIHGKKRGWKIGGAAAIVKKLFAVLAKEKRGRETIPGTPDPQKLPPNKAFPVLLAR